MDSNLYPEHPYSTKHFPNYRSEIDCGDVAKETITDEQLRQLLSTPKINPKQSNGNKKTGMHVIPPSILMQTALALTEGEIRYSGYNWRESPVKASTYYDSTWRHIAEWYEGQDIDTASGLPHIIKAIAGLIVLADGIQQGQFLDDRPKAHINPNWIDDMNATHVALVERVTKAKEATC